MRVRHGKFFARWRDENGIDHRKGFQTKREAQKFQDQVKAESRAKKFQGVGSVGQLTALWLKSMPGTPSSHWHDYRVAKSVIAHAGPLPVTQLSPLHLNAIIEGWKTERQEKSGKPYSIASLYNLRFRLKALCGVFERAGAKDLSNHLQKVPTPQARQVMIDPGDLEKLKAGTPPWFRCFILLCFDCGLRRAEALRCAPIHYSEEQGTISIEVKKKRKQICKVTDELKQILALAPKTDDPSKSFMTLLRGDPYPALSKKTLQFWWDKYKKLSGIAGGVNSHDLRRTAATQLYLARHDLILVQKFLGHAHPVTTLRYLAHAGNLELKPIVEEMKVIYSRRTAAGGIARGGAS